MEREIVVGYDASDRGRAALAWALNEARLRDADLVVCHAWDLPFASVNGQISRAARNFAESALGEGVLLAREGLPDHRIRAVLSQGPTGLVLARQSRMAAMLVVGTRGLGGSVRPRLDAVSAYAAGRARCPVTVVREWEPPAPGEPAAVVVAVAASTPGTTALALAFEEAAWRGAELHAWCGSWEPPYPNGEVVARLSTDPELQWLDETVPRWREKYPEVHVEGTFAGVRPLSSLLSRKDDVELVVVGADDARDSLYLLDQALRGHASCPVTVAKET